MENVPILKTKELEVGYNKCPLIGNLNLAIEGGELVCLIGPNGSGKSTLLRTLTGLQEVVRGKIMVGGTLLNSLNPKEIANCIAIVLTQKISPLNFSVYDMVAMGRIPFTNWLGKLSVQDKGKIDWAMDLVGISNLSSRQVHKLSDGEKQKVMVAKALAQDTPLIILDEPTAHLDVINRISLLILLKKLSRKTGKAILLSTHELDMAIQISDSIWLIDDCRKLTSGAPEDLVLSGAISKVFKGDFVDFDKEAGNFRIENELKRRVLVYGNGMVGNWTRKALRKEGFDISNDESVLLKIYIKEGKNSHWKLSTPSGEYAVNTIGELLKYLKKWEKT